tara:strand:- start:252 stop:533 length:282 start_codon:yes stop_codon:yes gene_type:complete
MDEIQRLQLEEELVYQVMNDTYRIIVGEITFTDYIIDKEKHKQEDWGLLFNGFINGEKPSSETLDNMISYFTSLEEYEKCAELVKYKKKNKLK